MVNTKERKNGLAVLMSVYYKDEPIRLDKAISSIINQTRRPDEIVLVKDGDLKQSLDAVIKKWTEKYADLFIVVPLERNSGLGPALMAGIEKVSYELVARMDADDISRRDRFEKQYDFLTTNKHVDLVGTWIGHFIDKPEDIIFCRKPPTKHHQINRLAKFRNPIEHGSVMFRSSKVIAAGGYSDIKLYEDYHLWAKMLLKGNKMANIPEVLYLFRRNTQMLHRRRGFAYLKKWITVQKIFLEMGFIGLPIFVINIITRAIIYILPMNLFVRLRYLIKL